MKPSAHYRHLAGLAWIRNRHAAARRLEEMANKAERSEVLRGTKAPYKSSMGPGRKRGYFSGEARLGRFTGQTKAARPV